MLRSVYERVFQQGEDAHTRARAATLEQVPALQVLSASARRALAEAVHTRTYARDEYLYYEGDPGLGLYVVQRGRVRLLTEDQGGAVHELRQVTAHEIFGEISIVGDFPRMETAQAATETEVIGFFRPDLSALTKRSPQAGAEVTAALARHLVARQVEVMHLVAETDGKVAAMRMLEGAALRTDAGAPTAPPGP